MPPAELPPAPPPAPGLDPLRLFRLDGRTALVTGARREIGRAIALGLAGLGAKLAIHHVGTAEETADAKAVVAEIAAAGGTAREFAADFSAEGSGAALAAAATQALGPIDILVLNASIELVEPWTEVDRARFDLQVNVNLWSTLQLLQALVPPMAARGWGRVVTIGSVQQTQPHPGMIVYAGYKAMQFNWAQNLARQTRACGVTVNNLAPGVIATARNRRQLAENTAQMLPRIPAGRVGAPQDLVGAAMLLCSEAGAYINGVNLLVDGGRSIS